MSTAIYQLNNLIMNNGILFKTVRMFSNVLYVQSSNCATSSNVKKCYNWDLGPIIQQQCRSNVKYAVIVLNRPILQSQRYISELWNNASVTMLVDGGTIRWNTFLSSLPNELLTGMRHPDYVTGDFDSVTEDVLEKYRNLGSKIIRTLDQAYTDFTKAVMELNNHCKQHNTEMEHVIAIVQTAGRLDQTLGNINTMFLAKEKHLISPNTTIFIMADDSLSWLLEPGDHVIKIPQASLKHKKPWCSLVPVGGVCDSISTSGLVWDMDKHTMQFGDLVSTSNLFGGSEVVKISCSHRVLWSMRIPDVFDELL